MQNEIPKCDGEESTASGDAWEGSTEGLRVPAHEVCVRSDSTQLSERTQSMQLHYSPKVRTAALRGTVPETYNGSSYVFCSKDVGNILGQLCKQKLLVGAIADRTDSDNFGNTLAVSRRYHEKENHKFPHTHKKKRPRQCITKTTSQLRMNGEKGLLLPNNKHPAQQVLCSTWVCHLCSSRTRDPVSLFDIYVIYSNTCLLSAAHRLTALRVPLPEVQLARQPQAKCWAPCFAMHTEITAGMC